MKMTWRELQANRRQRELKALRWSVPRAMAREYQRGGDDLLREMGGGRIGQACLAALIDYVRERLGRDIRSGCLPGHGRGSIREFESVLRRYLEEISRHGGVRTEVRYEAQAGVVRVDVRLPPVTFGYAAGPELAEELLLRPSRAS